jgi:hypothetical protein
MNNNHDDQKGAHQAPCNPAHPAWPTNVRQKASLPVNLHRQRPWLTYGVVFTCQSVLES